MAKLSKAEKQAQLAAVPAPAANVDASNDTSVAPAPAPEAKEPEAPKAPGKIAQIIAHFLAGKTNKEIADLPVEGGAEGETFHPTTISIQVSKYKKAHPDLYPPKPPALTKAQKKEIADAKKAEEAATKAANTPAVEVAATPGAEAGVGTPAVTE